MENLFSRPVAMGDLTPLPTPEILKDFDELNTIVSKPVYSADDKARLIELLQKYDLQNSGGGLGVIELREIRAKKGLFTVHTTGANPGIEIDADGREDWIGWFELVRRDVFWPAVNNTGRVVKEVNADILLAVEVEDRLTLSRFNEQVLREQFNAQYPFNILIDGNDLRGIDIGLFSRFPIEAVRTHIFDTDATGTIFSRDCVEFDIRLPGGELLVYLGNHYKSKGYGSQSSSNAKRKRQAKRTKAIFKEALKRSDYVIVGGDLNDTPGSDAIGALTSGTDMVDAMALPVYNGKPGTYGSGSASNKIDYLFLSAALVPFVTAVDVERRGVWAPKSHTAFDTVTGKLTQASDHAAVWVELNL
jgi:endonuclease/exonuclease/phosphatase family metal-dependent hydrolase